MEEKQFVDSASNARTANNTVRHSYRVLSDHEKAQMVAIKDIGAAFIAKIEFDLGGQYETKAMDAYGREIRGGLPLSRELELAKQRVEEAVMWAVKHITA